jgi:N-acetylglutamate synthase-like GNAT family acetyltransferase
MTCSGPWVSVLSKMNLPITGGAEPDAKIRFPMDRLNFGQCRPTIIIMLNIASSESSPVQPGLGRLGARSSDILVRPAALADRSQLADLRLQQLGSTRCGLHRADADFCNAFEEFLLFCLSSENWLVFVAEVDGSLVGCAYLQKIEKLPLPDLPKREFGMISSIFVQTKFQGRGIRRKLLRKIVEVAWAAGMETLVATSGADYHTLFCRLGFRQVALEMRLDRFENR